MNLQIVRASLKPILFSFLFASFVSTVEAGTCLHGEGNFKCVEFVRNYDGDTFVVDIPDVHHFFGSEISIRIRGIDTGEIKNYKGKTKCEHEMAIKAKNELARLFEKANVIELREPERGKFFRVLADVYINNRSVAKHMIKKGFAVEYTGGSRNGTKWCKLKQHAEILQQNPNNI